MRISFRTACGLAGTALALTMFVSALSAQQSGAAKPAEPKYTEIKYSADSTSYRWEASDRILVLKGNVKFVQGDTTVLADKVDYRERTNTATANGNLKIFDDQSTITGDACTVNFEEKKGTLTGNVRMVAKPKRKPEADSKSKTLTSEWKDEAVITSDKIEYLYKEKKAVIPSSVTIVQKTRTVTADAATYQGREETIVLTGNVKGRDDKDKHSFSSARVVMSLKENDEWIEAEKATGSFYIKETPEDESASEDVSTE